jgi:hypothetical protein
MYAQYVPTFFTLRKISGGVGPLLQVRREWPTAFERCMKASLSKLGYDETPPSGNLNLGPASTRVHCCSIVGIDARSQRLPRRINGQVTLWRRRSLTEVAHESGHRAPKNGGSAWCSRLPVVGTYVYIWEGPSHHSVRCCSQACPDKLVFRSLSLCSWAEDSTLDA